MTYRKKLIEVALPLEAINQGSIPETENPFLKGHPRAIHNWWARTPLSVSRAFLFAQLIDDPGNDFPPEQAKAKREVLIEFVAKLATWGATNDQDLIYQAQELIKEQFNGEIPEFWDPFAGRASIPLEAQRLGLKVTSSDLNPIAVTMQKCLLKFPQRFKDRPPIHQSSLLAQADWKGCSGLIEDIKWFGSQINERAIAKLSEAYPSTPYGGRITTWLWARTVKCNNPVCGAFTPLMRSFQLSNKKGRKTWIEPEIDRSHGTPRVTFSLRSGKGKPPSGTVGKGKGAICICCQNPLSFDYLRGQGQEKKFGHQLLAMVQDAKGGRIFIPASSEHEEAATAVKSVWEPDTILPKQALGFRVQLYGFTKYSELFTERQLYTLTTLCELISELREELISSQACEKSYADALTTYLACALSRLTDYCCSFATWNPTNENVGHLFTRQAIPMVWDFAEANPIYGKLSFTTAVEWVANSLKLTPQTATSAQVYQLDATKNDLSFSTPPIISTDPPYYDNISYADLSDFFYTWLRPILKEVDPQTFSTLLTPKAAELVASPFRHEGSAEKAKEHFQEGFLNVFRKLYTHANSEVPITVYYAFKQEEEESLGSDGRASTGWETMLEGLLESNFQVTGTWPARTNKKARTRALGSNALASAIVIVARPRPVDALKSTRRQFLSELKTELPKALRILLQENVAPVDLAQASIGPGMAIFSQYAAVLENDGSPMRVRTALQLINQILDEFLTEQEGEFDGDTRWALTWFEQYQFDLGQYGDAETLSKAKNTSVQGMVDAGILEAKSGKVRLLKRDELKSDWNPASDSRMPDWEIAQYLIHELDQKGELGAAALLAKLGDRAEAARDLAYRLYSLCDKKGWTQEAIAYNSLVISWPEITRLASDVKQSVPVQQDFGF